MFAIRAVAIWVLLSGALFSQERLLVLVEGNVTLEKEAIYEAMGAEATPKWQFWKEKKVWIKTALVASLKPALRRLYDLEGYYDTCIDVEQNQTHLHVRIDAKEPVLVSDIKIDADFPIKEYVDFKPKDRFSPRTFKAIKADIIKALLDQGFCSYDLDTKAYVDLDAKRAELVYTLRKGEVCRFGKTTFKGVDTIKPKVLMTRVRTKEGERYDPQKIKQTYSNLYALEAFETLKVRHDRKLYNVVPIDVEAQVLQLPYHIELGAGYDTYVGARLHGDITRRNLLGNGEKGNLKLGWSQKERYATFEFFKPAWWIWDTYNGIDGGVAGGYTDLDFPGFTQKRKYLQLFAEYFRARFKLKAGISYEEITISQTDAEALLSAVREGDFRLIYPFFTLIYDARDDKINPRSGYYLKGELEYGISSVDNASGFLKWYLEGRKIVSFDSHLFAMVLKGGVIEEKVRQVPESKLFFAGGSYSNRAYGFRSIGVSLSPTNDTIYGGATWLNGSLEYNYPILKNLHGAIFSDHTLLSSKAYSLDASVISSAGVGVRYMTPVGPFKLDVGFNVHDPSIYGITFQIGQSF